MTRKVDFTTAVVVERPTASGPTPARGCTASYAPTEASPLHSHFLIFFHEGKLNWGDPGRLVRPVTEFGGDRADEPAAVGFLGECALRVDFRVSRLRPQNP